MNAIAALLSPERILPRCDTTSKKRAFELAAQLFASQGLNPTSIFDALFAREKLGSTGLGQGIAIPHGRMNGLSHATGAFLRLVQPVDFDAPDGRPVSQLFVLLVPTDANQQHLQLLAELAQRFSNAEFRAKLDAASTPEAIAALFSAAPTNA